MLKSEVGKDVYIGYTDQNTVKLDLDKIHYERVKNFSQHLLEKFDLGGFLILRSSSKRNHHVVFDKTVSWTDNVKIMSYAGMIFKGDVALWVLMQGIKGHSTIRISQKAGKGKPRIIYKKGEQNNEIKSFREYREIFGKIR